jgi:transcriptional regulator with XRE-family HTH domain
MGSLSPVYRHVGARLRELREIRKLSQAELAEAIERGTDYVGRIERGEKRVQLEDLAKAAAALKVSLGELFRGIAPAAPLARAKVARDKPARYDLGVTPAAADELAVLAHLAATLDEDDVAALLAVARRMLAADLRRRSP